MTFFLISHRLKSAGRSRWGSPVLIGLSALLGAIAFGASPVAMAATLTAGNGHTCAITPAGGVQCWGDNEYGQLGNRNTTRQRTPVNVATLETGVTAIAAGQNYTCALTTNGGVKCWGALSNYNTRTQPQGVIGLESGVSAIASGLSSLCALTTVGSVKCWVGGSSVPAVVWSGGVVAIAAGGVGGFSYSDYHCALLTSGGVQCVGANFSGQLGNGNTTTQNSPVNVTGLSSGVISIAAGKAHTCATLTGGGLKCWGLNDAGQIGIGTIASPQLVPVAVSGLSTAVTAVALGAAHSCALTTVGGVTCWGAGIGQWGSDVSTVAPQLTPRDVTSLAAGVVEIAAGVSHTCARLSDGRIRCWGDNAAGQLGTDQEGSVAFEPTDVTDLLSGATAVSAGGSHTCAITAVGGVKCWGDNAYGQLGNGNNTRQNTPVDVLSLTSGIVAIAAGGNHTCAVTGQGGMKCWGYNFHGQLGTGDFGNQNTPTDVVGLSSGVAAISANVRDSCALTDIGGVKCWGAIYGNGGVSRSAYGVPDYRRAVVPTDVTTLESGAAAITAGGGHTCALTTAGGAKCWGDTTSARDFTADGFEYGGGQLGNGGIYSGYNRVEPDNVIGLASGVAVISAGDEHTCAVMGTGALKCWGTNSALQTVVRGAGAPRDVPGFASGVVTVVTGQEHTCVLDSVGAVYCWGKHDYGRIGDGNANPPRLCQYARYDVGYLAFGCSAPQVSPIVSLASGVVSISAGGQHTCALTSAGGVKCWGSNYSGQLGNGYADTDPPPVSVNGTPFGTCTLDVDGDGQVLAMTDGLLMLRQMLGVPDAALMQGAYNPAGVRNSANLVRPFIQNLIDDTTLDLDGDGAIGAATDGVMLLRALFGLTGSAVTAGAIGTGPPLARPTWTDITGHLNARCNAGLR